MSERLRGFTMIDPACGSGAFLVETLDQLHARYDRTNRMLAELRGVPQQMSTTDLDRIILRNNLHGRDLLPESIEITRLSIWLRTARKGERLELLDSTIATADSLRLNDEQTYDLVVGNPPWGADLNGWTDAQLLARFPNCGEEKDSYAIFVIRAWEMLKSGGILAFILPNSWLTVAGYEGFRNWLLRHFDILEITNVWKIFSDVNHDAVMMLARKRLAAIEGMGLTGADASRKLIIRSIRRGQAEVAKLKQLAEARWSIDHTATHGFLYRQSKHRFEVIFQPRAADELDRIAAQCDRLDQIADITVGIQVYHHTRVPANFIRRRGFHSTTKMGEDWYPYIDANDVQRYFYEPSTTQWLQFSELLHDKRELAHYAKPRILVQQILWKRLSATLQKPTAPYPYLNTLFSISNSRGISLACLLGIINSKFVSATYERRANRLFGDKFPKVSRRDLASLPIPRMSPQTAIAIQEAATSLQTRWQALRADLRYVNIMIESTIRGASLKDFGDFWAISENAFLRQARSLITSLSISKIDILKECYSKAKDSVDTRWHGILSAEAECEKFVQQAYGISADLYEEITRLAQDPDVTWAMRG